MYYVGKCVSIDFGQAVENTHYDVFIMDDDHIIDRQVRVKFLNDCHVSVEKRACGVFFFFF